MRASAFLCFPLGLAALLSACASEPRLDARDAPVFPGVEGTMPAPTPRPPVLFVHGINGSSADFAALRQRMIADGWDDSRMFVVDFADPSWGCNVDNAAQIAARVDAILAQTGATSLQVVAHSMGSLSSRHYLKSLGGTSKVTTYVTLGGMHHGLSSSCSPDFPGKPCVWSELCESGAFIAALNAAPATPGDLWWASIYGTADTTVPNASSPIEGAENVSVEGVDHMGLLDDATTFAHVRRILGYPPR